MSAIISAFLPVLVPLALKLMDLYFGNKDSKNAAKIKYFEMLTAMDADADHPARVRDEAAAQKEKIRAQIEAEQKQEQPK